MEAGGRGPGPLRKGARGWRAGGPTAVWGKKCLFFPRGLLQSARYAQRLRDFTEGSSKGGGGQDDGRGWGGKMCLSTPFFGFIVDGVVEKQHPSGEQHKNKFICRTTSRLESGVECQKSYTTVEPVRVPGMPPPKKTKSSRGGVGGVAGEEGDHGALTTADLRVRVCFRCENFAKNGFACEAEKSWRFRMLVPDGFF